MFRLLLLAVPMFCATTLSDRSIRYTVPARPYVVLSRGDVEAVIVTNEAVKDEVLADHRAGYSGVALLRHKKRRENLFVPNYAGLNFEHILDGTAHTERKLQFEPRNWPMELRVINKHTAEICQSPTFHHALESCQRYELLRDGVIQLTIEVAARRETFRNGYINLFWASYIDKPESLDIHFRGAGSEWIRGVTPAHGVESTHRAAGDDRVFAHDEPFPLTLVFNNSKHSYGEPWFFGVSHGLAFVQMFRPKDRVRITQSPSGGGRGNPAWDFQYFVEGYKPDTIYQFVMRAAYLPFVSAEQIEKATRKHRRQLNAGS
ncbi:MAG: hypothetical protein FJW32_05235 [Acidobacteria bacterium]|nr:hypothetical protein [Acidobacteriota bacterium]